MAGWNVGSRCPLRCVWLGSRYARGMWLRVRASSISALKPSRSTVTGAGGADKGDAGICTSCQKRVYAKHRNTRLHRLRGSACLGTGLWIPWVAGHQLQRGSQVAEISTHEQLNLDTTSVHSSLVPPPDAQ